MKKTYLTISITKQILQLFEDDTLVKEYSISTAKNGAGEINGSEKTPRGWHIVRAKIGEKCEVNTVFVQRRPTGEIYNRKLKENFPNRDWILTRILWLSGLEPGKNRLGQVDTMRRYIYIHGTPDEVPMGIPGSRGCVRMRNAELVELFNRLPVYVKVLIQD